MKHAGPVALDSIEDMLALLRTRPQLREKKRGTFYRKSSAFLHFHEDPAGLFADLKLEAAFERFPVNMPEDRETLLAVVASALES